MSGPDRTAAARQKRRRERLKEAEQLREAVQHVEPAPPDDVVAAGVAQRRKAAEDLARRIEELLGKPLPFLPSTASQLEPYLSDVWAPHALMRQSRYLQLVELNRTEAQAIEAELRTVVGLQEQAWALRETTVLPWIALPGGVGFRDNPLPLDAALGEELEALWQRLTPRVEALTMAGRAKRALDDRARIIRGILDFDQRQAERRQREAREEAERRQRRKELGL